MRRWLWALVLLAIAGCAGAGPELEGEDAGAEPAADGGPARVDGGGARDGGGVVVDGGVAKDGGTGEDAGPDPDAGLGPDAGSSEDGGVLFQWIGGPCDSPASCDYADALCLDQPGGLCSLRCTQFCPDRAGHPVTYCIQGALGRGECVQRCAGDSECRAGYRCEIRGRFDYPTVLQRVCVPASPPDGGAAPSPYPARIAAVRAAVDHDQLAAVLDGGGVPQTAKILAVKVRDDGDGGLGYEYFDWRSTGFDDAFWPASTIKLHAAVAALEDLGRRGHTARADVAYAGGYDGGFRKLVDDALIVSDNVAYDNLVFYVGFDAINTAFLAPARGFERTVIMRRYGVAGSLRTSPAITLREGARTTTLPGRTGTGQYDCPNEGNCTNPFELGDALRRVALHERLPPGERFQLTGENLAYLRSALASGPGTRLTPGVTDVLGAENTLTYEKAGWAGGWQIDNVFVRARDTGEEWVLTVALPDSASPPFRAIARAILGAFRQGRLNAAAVEP